MFETDSPFARDLHEHNPKLAGSAYADDGYFANNFNDVLSAYVILFELMVVNQVRRFWVQGAGRATLRANHALGRGGGLQWNVLAEGFVILTSYAARIFFLAFHMTAVLVMFKYGAWRAMHRLLLPPLVVILMWVCTGLTAASLWPSS